MKKTIFILIFLILISSVMAIDYTYNDAGNSVITSTNANIVYNTRLVSNGTQTPVIDDLDGDGLNEIIVLDGDTFKIYQNTTLSLVNSYDMNVNYHNIYGDVFLSNFIVSDIKNDGKKKIVIYAINTTDYITGRILIFNFSDSVIRLEQQLGTYGYQFYNNLFINDRMTIGCSPVNTPFKCAIFGTYHRVGGGAYSPVVWGFNWSQINYANYIPLSSAFGDTICSPKVQQVAWADVDLDGVTEWIYTFMTQTATDSPTGSLNIVIGNLSMTGTGGTAKKTFRKKIFDNGLGAGNIWAYCNVQSQELSNYITSPLVGDFSSLLEPDIIVGAGTDVDDFKMYRYTYTGDYQDEYPEVLHADGRIISSVFRADAFSDTSGFSDFCVMGYEPTNRILDLMCASDKTGTIPQTQEYRYLDPQFDLNLNVSRWDIYSQTIQSRQITTGSSDLSEIVTPYGIFRLDYGGFIGLGNELILDYRFSTNETGSIMAGDIEENGLSDVLVLTDSNIWYIDDGFSNSPGYLDTADGLAKINPCLDSIWKQNTTVGVTFKVSDINLDNTCAMAYLYYGETYQQNGSLVCGSSGTSFTFPFIANVTGANKILRIEGWDVENNQSIQSHDYRFTVATDGVSYDECYTTLSLVPQNGSGVGGNTTIGVPALGTNTTPSGNNSISNTVNVITGFTGLGSTIIWLLVMSGLAILVIYIGSQYNNPNPTLVYTTMIILEVLALIIGVILKFISTGILWAIIIICLMAGAIFIGRKVQSPTQ
jgi:hypothetical protein